MNSFIGVIQSLVATVSVWFVSNRYIGTFLQACAAVMDQGIQTLATGLQLTNPLLCDVSQLPILAADRGIDLYPGEPIASQRQRLAQWLPLRRSFGCAIGQMRNLVPFWQASYPTKPVPRMRIVSTSGGNGFTSWWTLNPDGTTEYFVYVGSNWNWDGVFSAWSRTWLIVDISGLGFTPQTWDGGPTWDEAGELWDGGVTYQQIQTIIASFNSPNGSKAAHETLWGVIFTTDPTAFDPTDPITVNTGAGSNLPDGNWAWPVNPATGYRSWPTTAEVVYNLGVA